jgi:hypothetical protein
VSTAGHAVCFALEIPISSKGSMAFTDNQNWATSGEVQCSYHPGVMTRLRCSRCGKPICPKCGVRTPVGLRCPDCAGVRGLPTYRTETSIVLRAAVVGLLVAVAVGIIWGYLPKWGFYLALVLGFGVAESMTATAKGKRGVDLQVVGWVVVGVGLALSRVVLANRLDLTWDQIQEFGRGVDEAMHLELVPDGLIAALPFLIIYLRFR